jgi:hypothetical protein
MMQAGTHNITDHAVESGAVSRGCLACGDYVTMAAQLDAKMHIIKNFHKAA